MRGVRKTGEEGAIDSPQSRRHSRAGADSATAQTQPASRGTLFAAVQQFVLREAAARGADSADSKRDWGGPSCPW